MDSLKNEKLKGIYLIMLILFIWTAGSYYNLWNSYIIPAPSKIIDSFVKLIENGKLIKHIAISLRRIFIGFSITVFLAVPLGIFFGAFTNIYVYFKPVFEFFRHTPPLALIPMIILWFGIGETSKIVIIILASFFPVFLNVLKGVGGCDKKYIEVGKVFNLSQKDIFLKIILPNSVPDILVGLKLGIGYSWRAIIGAELIAASSGIGYLILDAQQISRSDIVMLGIIVIGTLGIITDNIFSKIVSTYIKRKQGDYFE
ncbi:ABC transporter permease [uncultured Fusobacterium sp.]|uniref:ABC transporter permease n=1 Tax=uncultured Fusobacterium sp. TaxID=159267 RepID=UPI0027DD4FBB|nr:ABC transporter permease [uncultured Fusobacterium sp.]